MTDVYTRTRVRGLASWNPQKRTQRLLDEVLGVLEEYADHLPLTCRQVYYRLVSQGYDKTEQSYSRLTELMNRARRSGRVPFDSVRDDGVQVSEPSGCFHGMAEFWETVRYAAEQYCRNRLEGQLVNVELWAESGGMVPQLSRIAHPYGIVVFSSGGFDSTTAKYDAAARIVSVDQKTVVLHIGDHDPSGLSVFASAAEDVTALVDDLGGAHAPVFERVAVTPEQVDHYMLPSSPPKATDKRGSFEGQTTQCEALAPDDLAAEVASAIDKWLDREILQRVLAEESEDQRSIVAKLQEN